MTNLSSIQFSSVIQSCLIVFNPMDCSTSGLPVHHPLPEFTQTHVHRVGWCHPTISSFVVPFSSCLQSFPASGSFQMSQFFISGGQSIGVSASASVLPINIQDWIFMNSIKNSINSMKNLDSILKSRDSTLPTKVCLIKAMVFPVVMYGYESWTIKKAESEQLMLSKCGAGEDSWESLGQQGDEISQS